MQMSDDADRPPAAKRLKSEQGETSGKSKCLLLIFVFCFAILLFSFLIVVDEYRSLKTA